MIKPNVSFSNKFNKQYRKSPSNIKKAFDRRFETFLRNQSDSILHNHQLIGNYQGYRSINVTGDWRAIYSTQIVNGREVVTFELIGTHSQLYKK